MLLAGLVPAILEFLLVYSVEPEISKWILIQVSLFWFGCGISVYKLNEKNSFLFSIFYTLFLNSPWFIAESIAKQKPEHFLPLLLASIIQGSILAFISKKWNKQQKELII